jgi:hypothetical protein
VTRRARRKLAQGDHDLAVLRRARAELGELPTASLKRIQERLERALSKEAPDASLIADLEHELGAVRGRS